MNFKKITAIGTSVLIAGMTMGLAAAANYPAPFVQNGAGDFAVVYGTGAGVSPLDYTNAQSLSEALSDKVTSTVGAGTIKLTDEEVVLRGDIVVSDITATIQDNKLSALRDEKFSWDDGDGSDEYDFHEEIVITDGAMKVLTTMDDEELTGVALSNEKASSYKFVLEEGLNASRVGDASADTLYLEIMGVEYEIEAVTIADDSVTVTTSEQVSMNVGETYTVEGKTITVEDIFDGSVEVSVDGVSEIITTGNTEKISGVRVNVESIGYHANVPESSVCVLKVGKDISKTYANGEEYIGQDEDDPLWVWDISFTAGSGGFTTANDYIGVKYNADIDSANDDIAGDSIKYVGNGYVFPDNYAAITLDSLTDAEYKDIDFYFEDSIDLFNASDGSTALIENAKVLVIETEEEDAISVQGTADKETDTMYLFYNITSDAFQTFYRDVDGDYSPISKPRLVTGGGADPAEYVLGGDNITATEIATIAIGDTDLDVDLIVTSGIAYLNVTNDDDSNSQVLKLKMGGDLINGTATGTLERLGATAEDADALDIVFDLVDKSLKEYDYMDDYGIYVSKDTTVETEADNDRATLTVPEEKVYAQVTVSMGDVATDTELGAILVKDTEVASVATKNLVVVGGSCINSAAATLVGGKLCGETWTAETNAGVGKFLIKGYASNTLTSKLAVLVAGYDVADTTNAVTYFKNKPVDTSKEYLGTSATTANLVVA